MTFQTLLRRVTLLLAVALMSTSCLQAQNQVGTYLFALDKQGYATSYLFGTIHLPDKRVTQLPEMVLEKFRAADGVFTEIPMEPEMMLGAAQAMMLTDGRSLEDILPAETLEGFERELHAIHPEFSATPYMRLKVWAAATMLLTLETQMKNPGLNAMDLALYSGAKEAGKRVGGIENPEEQLALFEAFSEAEQIELMDSMLGYMKEIREAGGSYTDDLVEAYLSGDLQKIEEMMASYEMGDSALQQKFEKLFITDRNELMAKRIEMRLQANPSKSYFFAIGAAHLYGTNGVPKLLKDAGFEISRVQ
ncbi:TraB/GumN family protein [Cerasicoccus maritimus]|uniref:TraB/GumN family protein n=1 Tax=Cerasicoccus maritimus TaxID=490089 RepID=UPI0028529862|nr:TraB/GumN family protein [Cerasicoccus maritimus]